MSKLNNAGPCSLDVELSHLDCWIAETVFGMSSTGTSTFAPFGLSLHVAQNSYAAKNFLVPCKLGDFFCLIPLNCYVHFA